MLISVAEARETILKTFAPLETENVPLLDALQRVLAETIYTPRALPPFDNSSMDGFAVRYEDVQQTPVNLQVIGDVAAGHPFVGLLGRGEAVRITTGAPLPAGADTVVPVEETDQPIGLAPLPKTVTIQKSPPRPGANVRPAGSDLAEGVAVLSAGQVLRPQDVGMLALLGYDRAPVRRRPRIALLSSGDELTSPGQPLEAGKIYDSNQYALGALITASGAELIRLGIARDEADDIRKHLDAAVAAKADLIVTSAGVSVGAHDHIKSILESEGKIALWRVNMRPGKPLTFGAYRQIPFIGLPGNPVSCFVGFLVFVRPVIRKMLGLPITPPQTVSVTLEEPITSDGRESYLRGIVRNVDGRYRARLTGHQGSGHFYSLVQANALLIVPAGVQSLPENSTIQAWLLQDTLDAAMGSPCP